MRELGMTMIGVLCIVAFFSIKIYPDLKYTGVGGGHSCTGECYEEYVRVNGTSVDILKERLYNPLSTTAGNRQLIKILKKRHYRFNYSTNFNKCTIF